MTVAIRVEKPTATITKTSSDHTVDWTDRILVHSACIRRPKPNPDDPVSAPGPSDGAGALGACVAVMTRSVRRAGRLARRLARRLAQRLARGAWWRGRRTR